ncbi:hypothetical protein Zmor_005408 [Zophobas morio]|uniref:Uncharacterized protein n=1 Tax=Zophobas morio TaxID=2755281 RepID=A0AA38MMH3_9CUCU|nr:hypothetical protein Zmor_005408 [Zophobas morio]
MNRRNLYSKKVLQLGIRQYSLRQLTGAQQKYPWGVLAQAEFGATGLRLFSSHDGDSIYRKAYPHSHLHYDHAFETRPIRSPEPQWDLG